MPVGHITARTNRRRRLKTALQSAFIFPALLSLAACSLGASSADNTARQMNLAKNVTMVPAKSATVKKVEKQVQEDQAAPPVETIISDSSQVVTEPLILGHLEEPAFLTQGFSIDIIDQQVCTLGLNKPLATAKAGEGLMLAMAASADSGDSSTLVQTLALDLTETSVITAPSAGASPAPSNTDDTPPAEPQIKEKKSKERQASLALNSGMTEQLLIAAYQQTGRPVVKGGHSPATGFDAAGYTAWVFGQRGIKLPGDAKAQANGGRAVTKDNLRPGDLLIYRDSVASGGSYHVGIYTGLGNFIHAAPKTGVVSETAAFGPQFAPYFVSGRRYYDDPQATALSDSQKAAAASQAVKLALSELGPNDKLVKNIKKPSNKKSKAKSKKN